MSTLRIVLLFVFFCGFSILLATDACAIPTSQEPVKLEDVPVGGADLVYPKTDSTGTTKQTPPVANDISQAPEENSNSGYQSVTVFSAIFTLILCKII